MARDCTGNPRQRDEAEDTACVTPGSCGNATQPGSVRERSFPATSLLMRVTHSGPRYGAWPTRRWRRARSRSTRQRGLPSHSATRPHANECSERCRRCPLTRSDVGGLSASGARMHVRCAPSGPHLKVHLLYRRPGGAPEGRGVVSTVGKSPARLCSGHLPLSRCGRLPRGMVATYRQNPGRLPQLHDGHQQE